ncbi:UDP-N-acetylglucosamine 2-epimerase (hydrolyzing) [Alcanivorax sp. N3-2A]|nr:UDP-N-acetylglucosamine 2-epimerase (hydrolyzing) [Alcanivorax sp. N3-2A]|tara:strand:- start:54497 stop:55633 length:1137 start_codon:yes stop_codon:yes gene_type:complete
MKKRILFLTGTRADFGKLKSLISSVEDAERFEYGIFATGMHMMSKYGLTVNEIGKSGFTNVFTYMNQSEGDAMEVVLANTITGLSRYLQEHHYDLIVVHGDRVEALAGATVGALRNILVAHVEGGEVSGTIDELMRHAITKMSHLHFVASETARRRLIQLGEDENNIFLIGSPDVDVMLSDALPSLEQARQRYEIPFQDYAICMLHPVTTEDEVERKQSARRYVDALIDSGRRYVVIYPNNDQGCEAIFEAYEKIAEHPRFRLFPSLRFEYFLTLLKHADFIIGNSSAGIHEAPIYAVPTINVGKRQHNRMVHEGIRNVGFDHQDIIAAITETLAAERHAPLYHYGEGGSAGKFMDTLRDDAFWATPNQKHFKDLVFP